jgi:hypothetical protein
MKNLAERLFDAIFPASACTDVPAPIAEDVEVCCANCGDHGCEYCGPAEGEEPTTFEGVFGSIQGLGKN